MKIGRMKSSGGERLGIVTSIAGRPVALDVEKAVTARTGAMPFPNTMSAFAASGRRAIDLGDDLVAWAARDGGEDWYAPLDEVQWMIPIQPSTFLCAGRNFGRHRDESLASRSKQMNEGIHFEFPTGFVQLPHTLAPHRATVACPRDVKEMDYEIEVAAVIGTAIERVPESKALDAVFGYTVFNDLSAREWQRKEMRNQMILIGKNFPGFGPVGPYILTADEMPDPSKFVLKLRVNGDERQNDTCEDMIFSIAELISFWSRAGLSCGDMIASGTPGGVATHRKPDPVPYYLKPGDSVEAEVTQIGILETRIESVP